MSNIAIFDKPTPEIELHNTTPLFGVDKAAELTFFESIEFAVHRNPELYVWYGVAFCADTFLRC